MTKIKSYWLLKSEPDVYGWDDLLAEGEGTWDGVRNYTARLNLRAMAVGDEAFFYHSNIGLEIVGIVKISKAGFQDPSDETGRWTSVKVKPVKKLKRAVTLKEIRADPALAEMELLTKFRLSVSGVKPDEWQHILALAKN
jgi:predicted RNA-binding protein with PUA-like domain